MPCRISCFRRKSLSNTFLLRTGFSFSCSSAKHFNELVGQQREIERALAVAQSPDTIKLHPQAAARYRAKVTDIHAAIRSGDPAAFEAITLVRDLIDHILVIPTPKPDAVGLRKSQAALQRC